MASTMSATMRPGPGSQWQTLPVPDWSNAEVKAFLGSILPGHECVVRFAHTTGRVLASLPKEDLRRQTRDEEATNVIWVELRRLQEARQHQEDISTQGGAEPYTLFVRTPMDASVELEVKPMETIFEVKERLARVEGTPVETQRLMWNGVPMLDKRTLASYNIAHGSVVLLVPRLGAAVGQGRYAPPAATQGARNLSAKTAKSGIPRPRVPVVCNDIARPWPMSIEFQSIPEYQSFMLALQREAGRYGSNHDATPQDAPFLEILSADRSHEPVQTRISFDPEAELLLIDTVGDILMESTKYNVLLHLRAEQKLAHLVTGIRSER